MFRKDSVQWALNYVGLGGWAEEEQQSKSAVRALPSNWYTSEEMYSLERRAIFSRKWQLITHKARLGQPGDWLKFDIAGFQFILVKDRQGNVNGFHNICRHRAFPVIQPGNDSGCAKIFSCKYHGWSYGLNGKLTKAPGYQDTQDFDKSKNGLLPIHVRVDHVGFIWVNLDAKEVPEVPWEADFDGIDKQERYKDFNFDDYVFDHTWQMDGDYNWKILADNYNECYHCATTHPDIPAVANLESYDVTTKFCQIIHDPATTEEQRKKGLIIASTYFWPNVSTNITPHFFMIQRFVPHGPTRSTMSYQVFRNKNSSEEDFQLVNNIYKRVMSEDKYLCDQAQKNLNAGVFINGEMHPKMEKGPLYFQKKVRETVTEHHAREQKAKGEIWPAKQRLPETKSGLGSQKDIDFCNGLKCETQPREELAW
ncbi:Choline monooxygenase, chloroplastic [Pseudocercospora fuligena]|uniref:Choline monooxygenase, chloroplastic n=1 Tax=Pseudocercospora fuligena TaxID=685502 RepID=A0A8H6VG94_9PEZI|nr:Choline monooxygenase, chloroplastic [Pseudocercospora fuligena]